MLFSLSDQLKEAGTLLAVAEVHGKVRDLLAREGRGKEIPGIRQRSAIAALIQQHQPLLKAAR